MGSKIMDEATRALLYNNGKGRVYPTGVEDAVEKLFREYENEFYDEENSGTNAFKDAVRALVTAERERGEELARKAYQAGYDKGADEESSQGFEGWWKENSGG